MTHIWALSWYVTCIVVFEENEQFAVFLHLHLSLLLQACAVGPRRERVQMKHCLSPGVDGQCDTEDPYNVHHYTSLCLEKMKTTKWLDENKNKHNTMKVQHVGL